ncbi:YbaB/EbfC family nucleoid-associated protein [Nocardia sp. 2YAB30]|uniref:YbaB/EbfC family nucleoid-associated protein n=1 Tax=Nocardia sp. 2YAB30 TaxID=3233022 RepID=UPI003F9D141B
MANERRKADLAGALDDLHKQMQLITELQQQRAGLTGAGSVPNNYVTVTVNADNVVIQTRFSPHIGKLNFDELGAAVTAAAQAAVADVARKVERLTEPLTAQQRTMPTLQEMVEDLTGVHTAIPDALPATLVPPEFTKREIDSTAPVSGNGANHDERPRRKRRGSPWDDGGQVPA